MEFGVLQCVSVANSNFREAKKGEPKASRGGKFITLGVEFVTARRLRRRWLRSAKNDCEPRRADVARSRSFS
jgi:hypothetical protein